VHLEIHAEKCTGCRICENFCSFQHEGAIWPERTRITIVAQSDEGPFIPIVCRQCDDASCAAACPVDVIIRDERSGAWVVDVEECIGCLACLEACPFEGMVFPSTGSGHSDDERGIPLKCDLCGGEPECAALCPSGAITLER
jgi:carbon-monoxide dehydrogenase iron sulfur subunit